MDIKRDPAILRKKKIRQGILIGLGVIGVIAISVAVSRLKPAAPSVPESTVWTGIVKRSGMIRNIHGAGTLVPEEIRWIPATTSGRVEKIVLRPGAQVKKGTVILLLSNPDLEQNGINAQGAWNTSKAVLENNRTTLRSQQMQQESRIADLESQYSIAKVKLEADTQLRKDGIVGELTVKQDQAATDQAKNQLELAKSQLKMTKENEESTLAPLVADVALKKAQLDLFARQLSDLQVKSSMDGVLSVVPVEEGQQVGAGANVARVSDPTRLKAEVRISETQTKDLAVGQPAEVDTRNGVVKGHVTRIDPAAQGGTVGVDITLDEKLPPGARPDLSIDGTIELARLENVLNVERPSFGQENTQISVFKVLPNGDAIRTPIELGVAAVNTIEIKRGLEVGDKIILSDMSQYDAYERVRIVK